jgi:hypothetical protein
MWLETGPNHGEEGFLREFIEVIAVHNRCEIGADIGRGARYGHGIE